MPDNPHEPGWVELISARVGRLVSYVFLLAVAAMIYEIVSRYFFNAPTIWAHEATMALTAVGFICGGVYTMQQRGHIRITLIYDLLPERGRAVCDVIIQVVILIYLGGIFYGAGVIASKSWASGQTSGSAWNAPTPIIVKTALFLGVALMALLACVHLVQALRELFKRRENA